LNVTRDAVATPRANSDLRARSGNVDDLARANIDI
jgi:hypothetical protein